MIGLTYATVSLVRQVSGLTAVEASDSDVTELIGISDNWVDAYTRKMWSSSDTYYKQVQLASAYYSSHLLYMKLAGGEDKAKIFRAVAEELLKNISGVLKRV